MIGRNEFMDLQEQIDNIPGYMPDQYQPAPAIWQETTDTNSITVTYDSVEEEFTITFTNIPFYYPIGYGVINKPVFYESSETFIVDKPASPTQTLRFYADKDPGTLPTPQIRWGFGTSSDDDTNELLITDSSKHTEIGRIKIYNYDNDYPIDALNEDVTGPMKQANPILINFGLLQPGFTARSDTKSIQLHSIADPITGAVNTSAIIYYTEPLNDNIILGWSNGDAETTLDWGSNTGNYDRVKVIGDFKVDSDNIIEYCVPINPYASYGMRFGFTGTATTGDTLTIKNGMILNVT